jgi:hypothetical protein
VSTVHTEHDQLAVFLFKKGKQETKGGNDSELLKKSSSKKRKYPYPAKMPHSGGPPPCPELLYTAKMNE